ncbi:hypothetical protein T12_5528 [Trichinella patagoniensis]|uniref:Uncharacterized protein n=1 Tax=Trichinella patagoniensis TaxID=990121 RepID=A0A0V0ZLD3_9BILA|nr:hypothetical protein T12_5528 [Trichinella patagoniensis]
MALFYSSSDCHKCGSTAQDFTRQDILSCGILNISYDGGESRGGGWVTELEAEMEVPAWKKRNERGKLDE